MVKSAILPVDGAEAEAMDAPLAGSAGVDRINVLGSKTYLHGWAGYGEPPVMGRPQVQPPAQINYAGQQDRRSRRRQRPAQRPPLSGARNPDRAPSRSPIPKR